MQPGQEYPLTPGCSPPNLKAAYMADEPAKPEPAAKPAAKSPEPATETTTTTVTNYSGGRRLPKASGGQAFIIGCMAVAILDTTVQDLKTHTNKSPAFKIIIGGFIVTITLLIVSDSQPELAESMALLIMLATLFGPNGTALADLVTKITTGPKSTTTVSDTATTTGSHVIQS